MRPPEEVEVPLSENEQRLLEQMERALAQEDPKFASSMRGSVRQASGRRLAVAGVGLVAGLLLVVAGVANQLVALGVLGFVVMLGATVFAMTGQRRGPQGVVGGAPRATRPGAVRGAPTGSARAGGFMQRLEDRWDKRKGEGRGL